MKAAEMDELYQALGRLANPDEAESLEQDRAVLLLWFLRNVRGIDDLEALEYVVDSPKDGGFDGLLLTTKETDDGERHTLVVFQSRYPEQPKNISKTDIDGFVGRSNVFKTSNGVGELLSEGVSSELEALITTFDVTKKLDDGLLDLRLVFVTAGLLTTPARTTWRATNASEGDGYLEVWDLERLGPTIRAADGPSLVADTIIVACPRLERLLTTSGSIRVAIAPVRASDIVEWPGIDNRSLFDLNVRRELPGNRVRSGLDRAIGTSTDHPNFVAYHNGITIVCREIDEKSAEELQITDLSVVNGAQSVIALREQRSSLSSNLRIFVKFVELEPSSHIAREVAIRSNTQSSVNPRNLRALDGVQLRLINEISKYYADYEFVTRPDDTLRPSRSPIANDSMAQLICAALTRRPWLAVKKLSLFESDTYPTIYNETITGHIVVFLQKMHERIDDLRASVPPRYSGRSWGLTRIVLFYLFSEATRALQCDEMLSTSDANDAFSSYHEQINIALNSAVKTLKVRHDRFYNDEEFDDFKVEFKNEEVLKELGSKARETAIILSD